MPNVYEARIERMRRKMEETGMRGLYLMMSSDLQYLTGVERQLHNPTDDNKHGDEVYGAFLSLESGPVFLVPRMGASAYVRQQAEGKPWIEDIVVLNDGDDTEHVTRGVLKRIGNPETLGVSGRAWARSLLLFQRILPGIQIVDASIALSEMRARKDEEEIRIMKEAGEITDQVFGAVLRQMRLGVTEHDLIAETNRQIILHGGSGTSFHTNIWVSGPGIKIMYARDGKTRNTPLQPGAVVAFDFGIVYKGYASDFGRTVAVGEPVKEYRRYHDLVMAAQALAISAMRPGQITCAELNRVGRKLIEEAGLGPNFTHRLGHGIGIDVHEPPFLYELQHDLLEENMCFTIEPSIRGVVDVRVEDIVQVTRAGGVPFSHFSHEYLAI